MILSTSISFQAFINQAFINRIAVDEIEEVIVNIKFQTRFGEQESMSFVGIVF